MSLCLKGLKRWVERIRPITVLRSLIYLREEKLKPEIIMKTAVEAVKNAIDEKLKQKTK